MAVQSSAQELQTPAGYGNEGPLHFDVLILDGGSRQGLAAARSLGRAGLRVAVGECFAECDPTLPVLGFRSRYAAGTVVLPSFCVDPDSFGAGVFDFVRRHPTRVVLPASDGAVAALLPYRRQLADLGTALALASGAALERANSKHETLRIGAALGIPTPASVRVDHLAQLDQALSGYEFPLVIKPVVSWASQVYERQRGTEVVDRAEAVAAAGALLRSGNSLLVQELAPGVREGVTLFVVGGEVLACFAHAELRTTPALGGASVVRQSVPLSRDLYDMSVGLVRALGVEGLAAVEFRRDAAGRPLLMEVNARLVGTVETALHAGVDFPLLLWRWAAGEPLEATRRYRIGVRRRWLRGDMRWLRDNARRPGRPDSCSNAHAAWVFASEFVRTPILDCLDRDDLRPALAELRTTAAAMHKHLRGDATARTGPIPQGGLLVR